MQRFSWAAGFVAASVAGCTGPIDGTLETHELGASSVEQVYHLTVFVPDDTPHHVVFLFDGDDWTDTTASQVSRAVRRGELGRPPLVVGIGYGDTPNQRARDYTPPGRGLPEGHGEVEAFYGFVVDELIPWVEARYPSGGERVVLGHSFGGIAALWGRLQHPEVFAGAVALSPSLAFGDGALFAVEQEVAATTDDLGGALFLGAGTAETYGLAGLTEAFGEQVQRRRYPTLQLTTELFPRRVHSETFQPGVRAGLPFVLEAL